MASDLHANPNDISGKDSSIPYPTPLEVDDVHVPWTLQSFAFEPEIKRWSDRLDFKRQSSSQYCRYPDSVTGLSQHCTIAGEVCCSSPTKNGCCHSGYYCVGTERCCKIGTTACSTDLCCKAGTTCCGNSVCCASGTVCQGDRCVNPQLSLESVQSTESKESTRSVHSVWTHSVISMSTYSVASVSSSSRSIALASASHSAKIHKVSVIGGAVGGVVGGIALIAAAAFLWIFLKRKNNSGDVGSTREQMSPNNQPSVLVTAGGATSPYTPNSPKQPVGVQSYLGAGTYRGAAEVMPDQPTSLASSVTTPLPTRMERAHTAGDSISSLPYAIPPTSAAHPRATSHLGNTFS